jgi:CotS family spore coat protein
MKQVIAMDELLKIINREYGINADRLQPFHSLWKLTSPQGTFLLKKMHCSAERVAWLQQLLQQLDHAGFTGLVPLVATNNGSPAINHQGKTFVITPWQPGSHPSFTNRNHLKRAAQLWGELHQTAQGATALDAVALQYPLPDLEAKTAFLAATLHNLRSQPSGNRIDRALNKWGDYFLAQAEVSLEQLNRLRFDQWSRDTAAKGFCHNDPAPGNIIIQNKNWYLIDFELSNSGFFLTELVLLLQRALKANQWEAQLLEPLLSAYYVANYSSQDERQFLPALFCFPQAFWRLCRQRFSESLPWSEKHFQSRLWELTAAEPWRVKFLQQWFPEEMRDLPHSGG